MKYGLLRALAEGRRLGVAWYLFPCESHNTDGCHINYLKEPDRWCVYDSELFSALKRIVEENRRKVSEIEASGILGTARFSNEVLNYPKRMPVYYIKRCIWRAGWFARVQSALQDCDLIFADPDNGLCEDDKFRSGKIKHWKRLPLREAKALAEDRTAIIYYHNTRRKGGHHSEIEYWIHQLGTGTLALYWGSYSPRTFFVINPEPGMGKCLNDFAYQWRKIGKTKLFTKDTIL